MSQTIRIPLQEKITVDGNHHGKTIDITPELAQAIQAWLLIIDDNEADRVARAIQSRIDEGIRKHGN